MQKSDWWIKRTFVLGIAAATSLLVLVALPAHASYPGLNGKIVFSTERDGNREIYVMDADGTNQVRLTNNSAFDSEPNWSPDGTKIVFRSDRDGNREVYVMNADGTNQTRLTNDAGRDMQPMYSPDGTKIVFTSDRNQGAAQYRLWVMNADGTGQALLSPSLVFGAQASWSPDGTKIAYNGNQGSGNEIFTINADGTNITQLTANGSGSAPDWSPDGTQLVFSSSAGGDNDIFKINANGTGQVQLTNNAVIADNHPNWSPDGTKILFDSNPAGGLNYDPYVMNVDGTGLQALTTNVAFDEYPRYFALQPAPSPSPSPSSSPVPAYSGPQAPDTGVGIPVTFGIAELAVGVVASLVLHAAWYAFKRTR